MKKVNYTIEKELEEFLRKERVLSKFKKNVEQRPLNTTDETYVIRDISEAFYWTYSNKGFKFWKDLSLKYTNQNN